MRPGHRAPLTAWLELDDGGASAVLPLWPTEESPSDVSAECEVFVL